MKTLRAGVIGLGVGEQHLRTYRRIPDCDVVAICDTNSEKLREVGDRYGIERRFTDWRGLAEAPDIDIVSICSYDDAHAEQAIACLNGGKHVMIEKPIALFRADAAKLCRAWQDSKRSISSNLILRASPRFLKLKRMIEAGEFGELVYLEADYLHHILHKITEGWRGRMAFYCVTYGGGIHLIDLMRWLIGREVEEVCGMGNKILTRGSRYPYDDLLVNLMRFEGGALAKTTTNFGPARPKFHALNVYGTRKTFINDTPHAKIFSGDDPEDEAHESAPYPGMEKGDLIPDFVASVREGREPGVSATDVFRVMDVCFAAWESIEQRRTVKVSYLI